MAIGSSITTNALTQGATTTTLSKLADGVYQFLIAHSNGGNVPLTVKLRPASVGSPRRNIGITFSYNPTIFDAPQDPTSGRITVSINCDAWIGSVITETNFKNRILEALSVLIDSDVIDALLAGSVE